MDAIYLYIMRLEIWIYMMKWGDALAGVKGNSRSRTKIEKSLGEVYIMYCSLTCGDHYHYTHPPWVHGCACAVSLWILLLFLHTSLMDSRSWLVWYSTLLVSFLREIIPLVFWACFVVELQFAVESPHPTPLPKNVLPFNLFLIMSYRGSRAWKYLIILSLQRGKKDIFGSCFSNGLPIVVELHGVFKCYLCCFW